MKIPDSLTNGAFAKAPGVNVETIRYFQRKDLLPTPQRRDRVRPYGASNLACSRLPFDYLAEEHASRNSDIDSARARAPRSRTGGSA